MDGGAQRLAGRYPLTPPRRNLHSARTGRAAGGSARARKGARARDRWNAVRML
jgi:hypothetical protein